VGCSGIVRRCFLGLGRGDSGPNRQLVGTKPAICAGWVPLGAGRGVLGEVTDREAVNSTIRSFDAGFGALAGDIPADAPFGPEPPRRALVSDDGRFQHDRGRPLRTSSRSDRCPTSQPGHSWSPCPQRPPRQKDEAHRPTAAPSQPRDTPIIATQPRPAPRPTPRTERQGRRDATPTAHRGAPYATGAARAAATASAAPSVQTGPWPVSTRRAPVAAIASKVVRLRSLSTVAARATRRGPLRLV
jgi:hypothetical protein